MLTLNFTEKMLKFLHSRAINFEWKQVLTHTHTLPTIAYKITFVERKCAVCEK